MFIIYDYTTFILQINPTCFDLRIIFSGFWASSYWVACLHVRVQVMDFAKMPLNHLKPGL